MNLGIPPLNIEKLLESNPLKSRFLVRGLTVLAVSRQRAVFGCPIQRLADSYRCLWGKKLLLRKPLPCNAAAETALQPLIWCSKS